MYAAAGGASLASRQARQRQRQQKKNQLLQAKLHPPKASALSVADHGGASTPTRQSRQFHQLPGNYLRAPQSQGRKLSASYTAQSKLLLPIDEGGSGGGGDTQSVLHMRMHTHAHLHHSHSHAHGHAASTPAGPPVAHQPSHYQQFAAAVAAAGQHHGRVSPKLVHRHSGSSGTSGFQQTQLPKSATATLPLVSQVEATPPTTPSGAAAVKTSAAATATATAPIVDCASMTVPHHDAIIVTPATPMASPGHVAKLRDDDLLPDSAAEKQPLTGDDHDDDEPMQPPIAQLERKCSVYRMRRSDAFELEGDMGSGSSMKRQLKELQFNNQQQQYEPLLTDEPQLVFKGLPNGRKWQVCAYCEEGICVCEHIECAQGRAAWLERGRRCSVQESQQQAAACHRRWVKRNRIQDASLGGSSDDEDFLGVLRGPSTFANAFLYVGLGTIALGLVIAFVGTGEKGFKTVELRLIGPSLIGIGLVCCILRILFCICPSHCISSSKKTRKKNGNKVDADHTTSLLRGENKRVSIARGPSMQPKYPITHKRSSSKMLNEGMEALRQIATTSLFMQNEPKPSMNRVVPIIKEPENGVEAPLEMKKLDPTLNVCELSDEEDEDDDRIRGAEASRRQNMTSKTTANDAMHATMDTTITTTTAVSTTTPTTINTKTTKASVTTSKSNNSNTSNNNSSRAIPTTITTTTVVNEKPPLFNSANSKLSRQRVSINQQQQQQYQPSQPLTQLNHSQSLSSSSTVKDSIDEELLMETSLMIIKPIAFSNESRPPQSTVSVATALPPPPTYTGAISRHTATTYTHAHVTANNNSSNYDLPSATPHSYAISAAATATVTRESLIRGPLGMPLSVLTASSSTYAMPATPPLPSSKTFSGSSTTATTTAISLLPLPTTTTTAATAAGPLSLLPGQVMDTSPLPTATATTNSLSLMSTTTTAMATATTSNSLAAASNKDNNSGSSLLSSRLAGSSSNFNFPVTLSLPYTAADAARMAASGHAPTHFGITLAPPPTSPLNKFEPELLLSPAKLGQ